jgi:hypothetical protein
LAKIIKILIIFAKQGLSHLTALVLAMQAIGHLGSEYTKSYLYFLKDQLPVLGIKPIIYIIFRCSCCLFSSR